LREILGSGPVSAEEIEAAAREAGFAIRTLNRAESRLGAESFREGFGRESACYWRLVDARKD
jgi:hypothetical protein